MPKTVILKVGLAVRHNVMDRSEERIFLRVRLALQRAVMRREAS